MSMQVAQTMRKAQHTYDHGTQAAYFPSNDGIAHLIAAMWRFREVKRSSEREVRLSPSMIARETHSTQPVAPVFQSPIGPGAHPLYRAKGPRIPYPANHLVQCCIALWLKLLGCNCKKSAAGAATERDVPNALLLVYADSTHTNHSILYQL